MNVLRRQLKARIYRDDILFFVKEELGSIIEALGGSKEKPLSNDQERFLVNMMNLENKKVMICAGMGTGKTFGCAILGVWSVTCLAPTLGYYKVCILGGGREQSNILYDYIRQFINGSDWIREQVIGEPLKSKTEFKHGRLMALAAGPVSVRGKHPDLLILDEAAEIEEVLFKAAMIRIDTSRYPRLVIASTPHEYMSYFVEVYSKAEQFGYKTYAWNAIDCPWIPQERIDEKRKELDERTFNIEYLGKPEPLTGALIDAEDLRNAFNLKQPPLNQIDAPTYMGIDWGQDHPTVLTIIQRQGDNLYVMTTRSYRQQKWAYVQEQVKTFYDRFNVDIIYADRSHGGQNELLMRAGFHLKEIAFSQTKTKMVTNMMWTFEGGRIKIPMGEKKLREELTRYTTMTKKGDDYVDSLMLALSADSERRRVIRGQGKMWAVRRR